MNSPRLSATAPHQRSSQDPASVYLTSSVVGGFAILEAKSKAHAIELAKEFLKVAGEGECEIRQIFEGPAQ